MPRPPRWDRVGEHRWLNLPRWSNDEAVIAFARRQLEAWFEEDRVDDPVDDAVDEIKLGSFWGLLPVIRDSALRAQVPQEAWASFADMLEALRQKAKKPGGRR